jgi:NodT family efflux transporter outer membrane factor (OMF) lipoprotein
MALAGCGAGERPAAPSTAVVLPPAGWRDSVEGDAATAADWWRGFGDPVLAAVVEKALANNSDILIAAARVEEARAQFKLARAQQLPTLSGVFGGKARDRSVSPFGTPEEQSAAQGTLSVTYDLDLFGRLANATESARAALLASQAARDNVRLAVAASAAGGYITLLGLDARLAVLRDTLKARADSLHLATRRAEAGYAPRLDLAQAEAEYRATEQLIPTLVLAIRRQEDGLSLLLGENPRAIARGGALVALVLPGVGGGLPADLLRRRPDIAAAEQQLVAADRSLDSARAAFLPSVQLNAAAGYVASTLLSDPIGIWTIGGSILAPLFQGGRLTAQANAAAARRDQAAFAYRRAALTAFREVEDALAAVQRTAEQEQALSAQRNALADALRLATNRYRAGYSPYLEQLDAQRGLLAAELSLAQVRADRLNAVVSLYQALGGGWDAGSLSPPAP